MWETVQIEHSVDWVEAHGEEEDRERNEEDECFDLEVEVLVGQDYQAPDYGGED